MFMTLGNVYVRKSFNMNEDKKNDFVTSSSVITSDEKIWTSKWNVETVYDFFSEFNVCANFFLNLSTFIKISVEI